MTAPRSRKQPWVALALASFPLHWAWEMLQMPLYASVRTLSPGQAAWQCSMATGGDVAITLLAYAVVASVVNNRDWLRFPRPGRVASYLAVGLVITVALEVLNVQRWGRWSYASTMPRLFGMGVSPLLQWVVVPLAALWVVKRYEEWIARRLAESTDALRGRFP